MYDVYPGQRKQKKKQMKQMKKRLTAAAMALTLFLTIAPASAAAANEGEQLIPVTPTELYHKGQSAPTLSVEITDADPIVWNGYRGKIYQCTLPQAGSLMVTLAPVKGTKGTELVFSESPDFSKASGFWDAACSWSDMVSTENVFMESGEAGDNYYLAVVNDGDSFQSQTSLQAAFYPAKGRRIDLGKTYVFGGSDDVAYHDFQFTAAKSGYVSVDCYSSGENDMTFSLLDQNKKRISGKYYRMYDVDYPMYFGVEKGKTYYLRAKIGGLPCMDLPYSIRLNNHGVKERSGTTWKKAASVRENATVKGYVLPGKKSSDWYKVRIGKKRKVKFHLKNKFSEECCFSVYDKKGKKVKTKQTVAASDGGVVSKTRYATLARGTYRVKVYNKTKGDSGGYALKWK